MSGQETGDLRERITRAYQHAYREALKAADFPDFWSPEAHSAGLGAVLAELGYGTHRCVRCGQQQARKDDTCPPCDLLTAIETCRERAAEISAYRQANTSLQQINTLRTDERDRLRAAVSELAAEWDAALSDPKTARALGLDWAACLRTNLPRLRAALDQGDGQETT